MSGRCSEFFVGRRVAVYVRVARGMPGSLVGGWAERRLLDVDT